MHSINAAIERAEELGRNKAAHGSPALDRTNGYQTFYPTGALALDVYRKHGADGLKNVVQAYLDGYNVRARQLGFARIDYVEIKNRIGDVLPPAATAAERSAIPAAM